jgi:uncharacterized protein (TIGR02246 family)
MTHKRKETGWPAIALAALLFLATPASAADDVRSAIEAANKKWEAGVSRGDGAGVAALYTADGALLPAGSDLVRGPQAIGEFLQAVFDSGIKGASLTTVEVEACGKTAYEVGTYEFRGAEGKAVDHGKYVVVWKREDDSWKLYRDIWTTSVVPTEP